MGPGLAHGHRRVGLQQQWRQRRRPYLSDDQRGGKMDDDDDDDDKESVYGRTTGPHGDVFPPAAAAAAAAAAVASPGPLESPSAACKRHLMLKGSDSRSAFHRLPENVPATFAPHPSHLWRADAMTVTIGAFKDAQEGDYYGWDFSDALKDKVTDALDDSRPDPDAFRLQGGKRIIGRIQPRNEEDKKHLEGLFFLMMDPDAQERLKAEEALNKRSDACLMWLRKQKQQVLACESARRFLDATAVMKLSGRPARLPSTVVVGAVWGHQQRGDRRKSETIARQQGDSNERRRPLAVGDIVEEEDYMGAAAPQHGIRLHTGVHLDAPSEPQLTS
ncbi:unnamed protein product [Vitrella brassicaformis CCMP3155]|uniref:Uncharacterized protein n=1 Tax=Vitrella brassicaformis (strain CCMP3155) TaxID=1169540 RepID=A0A0G4H2A4_VITBC|nr:unnamed protein product [Vitrella brassicaformis CCMP3155]|eukprot:CEM37795.1 unnamed protein product [Vitrella brassicaformis CCMP3155]